MPTVRSFGPHTAITQDPAPPLQIRPYAAADRGACLSAFRSNLPRYFDESELPQFEAFLNAPIGDYHVVARGGTVVACGGCHVVARTGHLTWGMVTRQHHGASIGTALLVYRIDRLFSLPGIAEIAIDTSQHTAGFFARHGFGTRSRVADGFGPGIDRVSMSLRREDRRSPKA